MGEKIFSEEADMVGNELQRDDVVSKSCNKDNNSATSTPTPSEEDGREEEEMILVNLS